MLDSPLHQFKIKSIVNIELYGYNISITNSSILMIITGIFILSYFTLAFQKQQLVPTRLQVSGEILYNMILNMIQKNIGTGGLKFFPFIFTLFLFILTCNLLGMLPYSFTVTSHISITLTIAMMIFFLVTLLGLYLHGLRFFSLFLPPGTPMWLAPLMIIIEVFTYLSRPISLALRLAANMVAGHVLLKVMAGFVISISVYIKIFPIVCIIFLIGFELFVAVLQAYIFTILSCVYLNDAINLH